MKVLYPKQPPRKIVEFHTLRIGDVFQRDSNWGTDAYVKLSSSTALNTAERTVRSMAPNFPICHCPDAVLVLQPKESLE